MSPDQTRHVLDAIDGALDDWTVSGDAMRWTPEQPPTPGDVLSGLAIDPDAARRLAEQIDEALLPIIEWAKLAAASMGMAVDAFARTIRRAAIQAAELRPLAEPRADEDPKARALRLRQHRHTGPERAPAGRQKRPRRLM